MVKVYRTVWNESLGAWVAVSELSHAKGKSGRSRLVSTVAAAVMLGGSGVAMAANPCPTTFAPGSITSVYCSIAPGQNMALENGVTVSNGYVDVNAGSLLHIKSGAAWIADSGSNISLNGNGSGLKNDGAMQFGKDVPFSVKMYGDNASHLIENSGVIRSEGNPENLSMFRVWGNNSVVNFNNSGTIEVERIGGFPIYSSFSASTKSIVNNSGKILAPNTYAFYFVGAADVTNSGTITGGKPSSTITALNDFNLNNSGSISSSAGTAVTSYGKTHVRTSGTIETTVKDGSAIYMGDKDDELTIEGTSRIQGYAYAGGGNDALVLAGLSDGRFDLSKVGNDRQYRGFDVFRKTEAGAWTLEGDNTGLQRQDWKLEQGKMELTGKLFGSVTKAGTTAVDFVVNGGSIDAAGGTAISMETDGDARVVLDGTRGKTSIKGNIKAAGRGNKILQLTGSQGGELSADTVSGFAQRIKDGSGTWRLVGGKTASGGPGWELREGTFQLANNTALGAEPARVLNGTLRYEKDVDIATRILVEGPLSVQVMGTDRATQSGELSGAGQLTKTGSGTYVMNGNHQNLTGAFDIREGEAVVNGKLGSRQVNVRNGSILSGSGEIAGNVDVDDGGHLSPGRGGALGKLTINGNLGLSKKSMLDWDIAAPGKDAGAPGFSDAVHVRGNVILDGELNVNDLGDGGIGYYRIMTYEGSMTDRGFRLGKLPSNYAPGSFKLDMSRKGAVDMVVGSNNDPRMQYWNGKTLRGDGKIHGGDGVWSADNTNWTDTIGHASAKADPGKVFIFDQAGGTVTIDGARTLGKNGMQVLVDGYRFVAGKDGKLVLDKEGSEMRILDGATATIDAPVVGDGPLRKTAGGKLVLNGVNTYKGGTQLEGGTVAVSSDANLGDASGGLAFNGGILQSTKDMTTARHVNFGERGGGLNVDGGTTLKMTGKLEGKGGMVKKGKGRLVLSAENTYAGGTSLEEGMTRIEHNKALGSGAVFANGGGLDFADKMEVANDISLEKDLVANVDGAGAVARESGRIGGKGKLVKTGAGTLIVGNEDGNNYSGDTDLNEGTLRVVGKYALGQGAINANGGRLDFTDKSYLVNDIHLNKDLTANVDGADAVAFETGNIDGAGRLVKTGEGKLVLAGESTYTGGTEVIAGMIGIAHNKALGTGTVIANGGGFDIDDGIRVDNGFELKKTARMNVGPADAVAEVHGPVTGAGGIEKTGLGRLIFSGAPLDYTGETRVREGSMMIDTDAVNTHAVVDKGATLGGKGKVGYLEAHGVIDPAGDDSGTLSVVHDALLGSDATYRIATVSPEGNADMLRAGGTMKIEGSAVDVVAKSGEYQPRTTYKVATADGGLSGQFGATSVNLPFLTAQMSYDANSAYMTLVRSPLQYPELPGIGPNEKGVGGQLEPMPFNSLIKAVQSLTADDARKALKQLSGESYGSLTNATRGSLNSFMSGVWSSLGGTGDGEGASKAAGGKSVWVQTPAMQADVKGDQNAAGYRSSGYGVLAGMDSQLSDTLRVGVAGGLIQTKQNSSAVVSKGTLDNAMLAMYGQYDRDRLWVGGMLGAGVGRLENQRSIDFPGFKAKAKGSASVQSMFARIGTGYRIPLSDASAIEPMASLDVSTSRSGEIVESGGGDANLRVNASTSTTVASELGARMTHRFETDSGKPVTLEGALSWRHLLNKPSVTQSAAFAASPAAPFAYQGVAPAADSAVLGLSLKVGVSKSSDISVGYQGQFGAGQTGNGIMGQYRMKW